MSRTKWLHLAEVLDSLRVFPRLFLLSCFLWTAVVTSQLLAWYMSMPKEERGIEASGFASVVFVTVFGFLKLVFDTYSKAGRAWGPPDPVERSSTVVATTTEKTSPETFR